MAAKKKPTQHSAIELRAMEDRMIASDALRLCADRVTESIKTATDMSDKEMKKIEILRRTAGAMTLSSSRILNGIGR